MENIEDWQKLCIARYWQYPDWAWLSYKGKVYDKKAIISSLRELNSFGKFLITIEQTYFQAIKKGAFAQEVADYLLDES